MPRGPRLDAPGVLHHVMVRGIERRPIFRNETDREDFVARLAALVEVGALAVYVWALLPTHAHLLVRTGSRPVARSIRSWLTRYAGAFNRRHKRVGKSLGLSPEAVAGRSRVGPAARARQLVAYLWVERLGRPVSELGRAWGWSRGHATWAATRGAEVAQTWRTKIEAWCA